MRRVLWAITVCLGLSWPSFARAVEVEVWPRTWFQLQQYRDVEQLRVDKSRFTQYLTLNLYETAPLAEEVHHEFQSNVRLDYDVGQDHSPDAERVPHNGFDLLYAYYQGNRLGNVVDVRLGRQVLMDPFDTAVMDGLWVQARKNWLFGADFYAGSEVRKYYTGKRQAAWLPNPQSREGDGVTMDDRVGGLFGGSVFLDGMKNTDVRLMYKHGYSGEQEKMLPGAAARQRFFGIWEIYALGAYDALFERVQDLNFGTSVSYCGFTVDAGHRHQSPRFDADSIFNFFDVARHNELYLNLGYDLDELTRFRATYAHLTHATSDPFTTQWGHTGNSDDEASFDFSRRLFATWDVRAGYDFSAGWSGTRHGMGLGTGAFLYERIFRMDGAFSGSFYDKLTYLDILETDLNDNFAWGLTGIAELFLRPNVSFKVTGEWSANQFMERQFSMFTLFEVHGWFGG